MVVMPFRAERIDTTAVKASGVRMRGSTISTIFERIPKRPHIQYEKDALHIYL